MSDIINQATEYINILRGSWGQNLIFGISPKATKEYKQKHYDIVYRATTLIVLLENAIQNMLAYDRIDNKIYTNVWIDQTNKLLAEVRQFYVLNSIKMKPGYKGKK